MNPTRQLDPTIRENARSLRRELSPAEKVLWQALRNRRVAGLKFRRQHPVGAYVVDFVCLRVNLGIELDGESHLSRNKVDEARDRWLASQGIKILRFWNTEVFDDIEAVMEKIWQECTERMKSGEAPPLTPDPSSQTGEGRSRPAAAPPLTPGPSPQGGEGRR